MNSDATNCAMTDPSASSTSSYNWTNDEVGDSCSATLTTDQVGTTRPQGGRCDTGAIEVPFQGEIVYTRSLGPEPLSEPTEIWVMSADGTRWVPLTDTDDYEFDPA
ncbi:MAG TPA: choice-of-anchor Q domain-containing protein, partial [Acidimicrobiales bacterium]|nr:choice-of-anchor Q domain-containing protein [Acidimicrobiales bacterium]